MNDTCKCGAVSPSSGKLCTMGKGHFGPHKVGGPYNTTEVFVIKCETCEPHHNSDGHGNRWNECIFCGHRTPYVPTKLDRMTDFQKSIARLIATGWNGTRSTTSMATLTKKGNLAVYSALASMENRGLVVRLQRRDRWSPIVWALSGELKEWASFGFGE